MFVKDLERGDQEMYQMTVAEFKLDDQLEKLEELGYVVVLVQVKNGKAIITYCG